MAGLVSHTHTISIPYNNTNTLLMVTNMISCDMTNMMKLSVWMPYSATMPSGVMSSRSNGDNVDLDAHTL